MNTFLITNDSFKIGVQGFSGNEGLPGSKGGKGDPGLTGPRGPKGIIQWNTLLSNLIWN